MSAPLEGGFSRTFVAQAGDNAGGPYGPAASNPLPAGPPQGGFSRTFSAQAGDNAGGPYGPGPAAASASLPAAGSEEAAKRAWLANQEQPSWGGRVVPASGAAAYQPSELVGGFAKTFAAQAGDNAGGPYGVSDTANKVPAGPPVGGFSRTFSAQAGDNAAGPYGVPATTNVLPSGPPQGGFSRTFAAQAGDNAGGPYGPGALSAPAALPASGSEDAAKQAWLAKQEQPSWGGSAPSEPIGPPVGGFSRTFVAQAGDNAPKW